MIAAPPSPTRALEPAFLAAFRSGTLTEPQAAEFARRDPIIITFLLLQLSAAIANGIPAAGPHAPSGSLPPYAKPAAKNRKKTPGAKPGHPGHARPKPERIDRTVVHELPPCPGCHGPLADGKKTRTRVIENIPDDLKVETTEHIIPRGYCKRCDKQYEPNVPDALPNATVGNRTVVLTAWLHYGLGTTLSQVVEVLDGHLRLAISGGGLVDIWHRLADVLSPCCAEIGTLCRDMHVLHMEETGWRIVGDNGWLWCATGDDATYYWIHASRGHAALNSFFADEFSGVLVADFWAAYDAVAKSLQKCWPHLLRDLKAVDETSPGDEEWRGFAMKLRRITADGIRLKLARDDLDASAFESRLASYHRRLLDLGLAEYEHAGARRLAKRLVKYWDGLLTFVEFRDVPSGNNRAERAIRPAVLMRKASYGSGSERGAATRGVLMSIYRTPKQRGVDPLSATESALRTYIATGKLPPLPAGPTSGA
ncbi:MAG: IS66 family transposase [Fimbriiglobus sp.]